MIMGMAEVSDSVAPDVAPDVAQLEIPIAPRLRLGGLLAIPQDAQGLIVFVHGSGSSRFSPRNGYVAGRLNAGGFGTLLMDLLTPEEERVDAVTRELRFDVALLAERVVAAIDWLEAEPGARRRQLGLFGASTGAAAALLAASRRPDAVAAVVSRGGRPDLAGDALEDVQTPTLLIVGGRDPQVIALNQQALGRLPAPKELAIVPGATHLFEEPGALEQVAALATGWFRRYLPLPVARAARTDERSSRA
jgi:dienelactone hydrolase